MAVAETDQRIEHMSAFPDPDMDTHNRLVAAAEAGGVNAASALGTEILSAVTCFLIGTAGPMQTAEILRDWAANVQRRAMASVE
jgi:hypothetical protein